MEKQQSYPHGLLYSVAPYCFASLRLHEVDGRDTFDWEAYKSQTEGDSFLRAVINFLKSTV